MKCCTIRVVWSEFVTILMRKNRVKWWVCNKHIPRVEKVHFKGMLLEMCEKDSALHFVDERLSSTVAPSVGVYPVYTLCGRIYTQWGKGTPLSINLLTVRLVKLKIMMMNRTWLCLIVTIWKIPTKWNLLTETKSRDH